MKSESAPAVKSEYSDESMEQIAIMLLQIAKRKEPSPSPAPTSAPAPAPSGGPAGSYMLPPDYSMQLPCLDMKDKRPHLNEVGYSPYPMVCPSYSYSAPKTACSYPAHPRSGYVPCQVPVHPPIPTPVPVHKPTKPSPTSGDYFVFCTVCRKGTPIDVSKPIPEVFKCSGCGFSCALDTHLLAYYVPSPRLSHPQNLPGAIAPSVPVAAPPEAPAPEAPAPLLSNSPVVDPRHTLQTVPAAQAVPTVQAMPTLDSAVPTADSAVPTVEQEVPVLAPKNFAAASALPASDLSLVFLLLFSFYPGDVPRAAAGSGPSALLLRAPSPRRAPLPPSQRARQFCNL